MELLLVVGHGCSDGGRPDRHGAAVLPGTTIILAGSDHSSRHARAGEKYGLVERSPFWLLLTLTSYALDFPSGYFGAKYFGATKWGMLGAIIGGIVGLFFGFVGLFVGPVVGAIAGEFIAGKRMIDAGRAGWGSLLGNWRDDWQTRYRPGDDRRFS